MGEVYRARDTKLGRDVAIKVLPRSLALDPERLLRLEREARVLAALNHPHIAAIYGFENANGISALVLELVEGLTLADRVAPGPIPIREALPLSRQIAEALEAAHAKGIIHRDLKPANIKIASDGMVKVLDFGLAKAFSREGSESGLSKLPTVTTDRTGEDRILGTPGYMSPEQARGQSIDKRTDVWAFGCVLYQMLTGRVPFSGETPSDTISAILTFELDWSSLPGATPASIRRLLRRCLEKDSKRRLHDIADARIEIEDAMSSGENDRTIPSALPQRGERRWRWATVASFVACIAAVAILVWRSNTPTAAPPEIRVEVNTPAAADPTSFAISPDGRRLVFSAPNQGKSQLWVRPLNSLVAQPLAGTYGASYPFWSPDSASVGFFADGKLKRIDIASAAPQVLANAPAGRGGAWNREGTILFAPTAGGPLLKLPATGGEPVAVTRLERGQVIHRFPQFLPDGRHFIYFVEGGGPQSVYAGSVDGGSSKRVANADSAAVVSPSGFLLFLRQTTLLAQAFDFKRLEFSGNPFPVAGQAAVDPATFAPGFSATSGIVAYRTGSAGAARQLTWLDRSGKKVGTIGPRDIAGLRDAELSPDGKRVAVTRTVNGNTDVWLIDAARGVLTRFTFDTEIDNRPIWSPDGSRVVFKHSRRGVDNLYWKLSSGAAADELLLESDQNQSPIDWSSDQRFLLFRSVDPQTGYDLWVLPMFGDKKPVPFLKTPFDEREGQFSPDGKWIAYQSNESGWFEIYVRPFPGPGGKFQISSNGGAQPRWNKNGKEIFYVSLDSRMMAVLVKLSPDSQSVEAGMPAALFPVRIAGGPLPGVNKHQYAVSSDGQRFLVNLAADEDAASPITLIYNWKPNP